MASTARRRQDQDGGQPLACAVASAGAGPSWPGPRPRLRGHASPACRPRVAQGSVHAGHERVERGISTPRPDRTTHRPYGGRAILPKTSPAPIVRWAHTTGPEYATRMPSSVVRPGLRRPTLPAIRRVRDPGPATLTGPVAGPPGTRSTTPATPDHVSEPPHDARPTRRPVDPSVGRPSTGPAGAHVVPGFRTAGSACGSRSARGRVPPETGPAAESSELWRHPPERPASADRHTWRGSRGARR